MKTAAIRLALALVFFAATAAESADVFDLSGVPAHLRTNQVTKLRGTVTSVSSNVVLVLEESVSSSFSPQRGRRDPVRTGNFLGTGSLRPNPKYSGHFTVVNYTKWKEASVGDIVDFYIISIPLGKEGRSLAFYVPPPKPPRPRKTLN